MRVMTRFVVLAAVLVGAIPEARGYQYSHINGTPIRWPGTFGLVQNLCSINVGTPQSGAYVNGIDEWRHVHGMNDMIFHWGAWPVGHCSVDLDDEWNDVALVDPDVIDGVLGRTFMERDGTEITRVDTLLNNTRGYTNPDEAFATLGGITPNNSGRATTLHEFGHMHGLANGWGGPDNHPNNFSIMKSGSKPLVGGLNVTHVKPMGDDAAGGRFLYPSGNNEWNVAASAQTFENGDIANNTPWQTINRCRGETFTVRRTTANLGTVSVTINHRIFLVNTPTGHNAQGYTVATWTNSTNPPQSHFTATQTATVSCSTPSGLYWVFHKADSDNTVNETWESDNVVHLPLTVQVNNCGC